MTTAKRPKRKKKPTGPKPEVLKVEGALGIIAAVCVITAGVLA